MKCKNCGGELLFQKENGICQSCGAVFAIDAIYEDIDVYIAYEENDNSGRRTKDSLIAQEVYKGLEKAKIHTFYERISADGLAGEELEAVLYAARQKAKILVILGGSVENFHFVIEKCGSIIEEKTVVPFCVDVNPGEIPKVLSKIQAVNYNTIGWEQDLVNGIYKLLGREKEVDTEAIYKKARNRRMLLMGALAVVLLTVLFVAIAVLPDREKGGTTTQLPTNSSTTEPPAELPTEAPAKPLTQQEKFDRALELVEQGKYCEALALLSEIPGHSGSSHEIKRIYSKYEGYYQEDIYNVHIEISDDYKLTAEVKITSDEQIVSMGISTDISVDKAVYDYVDNHKNTGTIQIALKDDGLILTIKADDETSEKEIFFAISEKSDQPIRNFNKDLLMGWLANNITLSELREMDYAIEWMQDMDRGSGEDVVCKLEGAEIYLTFTYLWNRIDGYEYNRNLREYTLCGVMAPAEWIAPELIGEDSNPKITNNEIYCPNQYYNSATCFFGNSLFVAEDQTISNNTFIGVVTKENLTAVFGDFKWEDTLANCN